MTRHSAPIVMWFRRDLRVADHEALAEAAASGPVLALYVLDPAFARSGAPRKAFLRGALDSLSKNGLLMSIPPI